MPDAASHLTPQELTAYRQGRLPEAAAAAVADHLAACPACRGAAAPPPLNLPPELANHPKFRIIRELGKGGMGVIYLAEHRVMDKPVALKVIGPAVLDNPTAVGRFLAEVRAAGKLDHQNIARAYDADRAGNLHFLVMEFIEGVSLAQLLEQRGPLSVAHACHYVRQAALGLQHAFEQGMVHRDIKPHNLMLTPKGLVKVLDFGLARLRTEQQTSTRLTQMESFMGTPEYVAPEQATDARKADARSDVYSLGCTLYALLAGRPPFTAETAVQLVLAHIEKEPRPLPELRPDVPAGLWAVLARMLAKDPAKRFQRPIDVAQALAPFVQATSKAEAVLVAAPVVAEPTAGTVIGGDTRPEKRRGPEKSKSRPRRADRDDRDDRDAPAAARPALWSRPVVLAGAAATALVLVLVAVGVVVAAVMMSEGSPPSTPALAKGPAPATPKAAPPTAPAAPARDTAPRRDTAPAPQKPRNADKPKKPQPDPQAEARRRAREKEAKEKKEAEETARRKQAEEERQRREEQEAEERKADEARKARERVEKAEKDAEAKLKFAKRLLTDAEDARRDGNLAEEKRLKDEKYPEALREITKKFRGTKAAKEAQKLLDDL